jgi:hypothetical protein
MINNLTNIALAKAVCPWAVQEALILDNYTSRIVGGIGILMNLFFVLLLSRRTLKHKIYDFLWCRQITSLITCIPVTAYNGNCFSCDSTSILTGFIHLRYSLNFKSLL